MRIKMKMTFKISLIAMLVVMAACAKSPTHTVNIIPSNPSLEKGGEGGFELPTQRVYFPFASDSIQLDVSKEINTNVEWLKSNKSAYIILEGHCDEIGPSEFNMELGDRRARAVKSYLIEQGIPAERIIMVVSYGSTRPLNPGHRAVDLRDNRRVEFVIR